MNNNPFKKTRLLFWTLLLIAAVTTILFETGILTRGAIEVSATTRYLSDVTGVLITICLIPIAIKKFINGIIHTFVRKPVLLENVLNDKSYAIQITYGLHNLA